MVEKTQKEEQQMTYDELSNIALVLVKLIGLLKDKYPNDQEYGEKVRYLYSENANIDQMIKDEGFMDEFIFSNPSPQGEC